MTDQQWLQCDDPNPMIAFLLKQRNRKTRLAAVAACRLYSGLLRDKRSQEALEVAERFADDRATDDEREAAYQNAYPAILAMGDAYAAAVEAPGPTPYDDEEGENHMVARDVAEAARAAVSEEPEGTFSQLPGVRWDTLFNYSANILRDVFGPVTPVPFDPRWLTSTVTALAGIIYEQRNFDLMPVLADALEDAGCTAPAVLEHCRHVGPHGPYLGQHWRGCWVVDLLLGKA